MLLSTLRRLAPQPRTRVHAAMLVGDGISRCSAIGRLLLATYAILAATAAPAETIDHVVVMPAEPASAERAAALLPRLEALLGTKLTLVGTSRTGALELAMAEPREYATVAAPLREDRAVLWVDRPISTSSLAKARHKALGGPESDKLLVRLAAGVTPDWSTLNERFSTVLGLPVHAERQIGSVWVLRLGSLQDPAVLAGLAETLQQDAAVQYADPVLRRYAQAVTPDDPYFGQQWNLTDATSGIDLANAWAVPHGSAPVTVAVVDTGILPHPDLAGRVLPGYDFISDAGAARDGDGRDADPRDEGDWMAAGDCGGYPNEPSSWHGTFVSGLIAAIAGNGIGIAGIDQNARVLPVRALGHCGGTDEDIFEAVMWAAGADVTGVPPNPNPAKVINLSLGGFGACAQSIQDAVNDAMAHGAIVVAAAGNESDDVSSFAPANCSGVITVGAHNRAGERTSYSNFGRRVDISAPAGDGHGDDTTISLSNDGLTVPGEASYHTGVGTSFSAPMVTGTVSLMMGRNPTLTAGRVLSILQATARSFMAPSPCSFGNLCGIGMLDAGLAVGSTIPASDAAPAGTVAVIEYYNAAMDHYFMTSEPTEIAALDAPGSGFVRTGYVFYAYADATTASPTAVPVCRFYGSAAAQIDSHFFTASADECAFVQRRWPGVWILENHAAFYVEPLTAAGTCPGNTLPVYRFFNGRRDANHRFSMDLTIGRAMVNRAWVPDGPGANGAAFCAPV